MPLTQANVQLIIILIIAWFIWKKIFKFLTKRSRYIPSSTRKKVLKKHLYQCAVCTETRALELHHRKPFKEGGTNHENNLVPLCPNHHSLIK